MDIMYLKGVGPKRAELYKKLGVESAEQLLRFYPRDYIDFTNLKSLREATPGEVCAFRAFVQNKSAPFSRYARIAVYKALLSDGEGEISAVFFNSRFNFDKLELDKEYIFYGKITGDLLRLQISSPMFVPTDQKGLVPKYPLTAGLTNNMVTKNVATALENIKITETLPEDVLEKYSLLGAEEAVRKIHFPKSREEYESARRRLVFEELLTLKLGLSQIKDRSKGFKSPQMKKGADKVKSFMKNLPFEPTGAQKKAVGEVLEDMKRGFPMNRLIQGDVGSGKTLVAAAAAVFAFENGCQTMVMAPTEVLARQHYETFRNFLEPLGIKTALLSGSLSAAEKKRVRALAAEGEADVMIGTHALIQKGVELKNLGLCVVDEQHRFGVTQRGELAEKGLSELSPHILAMSATPIPRTLALIVYGDLSVSALYEMPKGRIPVKTYSVDTSFRPRIFNFIKKHIAEGRQAFIVCPLVEESEVSEKQSAVKYYKELCEGEFKGIPAGLLFGKMKQAEKDAVMADFRENKLKLLVSTTVIEVGIDVPNASVMLIENAEQFGLSQLHQLRGRVGRGSAESFCILMSDMKTEYAKARFKAMCDTTDGYKIADTDLQLRGPGNFFGREQHGLPTLKIADLCDDARILPEIDELAEEILRSDPLLKSEKYKGLKENTAALFGELSGRAIS